MKEDDVIERRANCPMCGAPCMIEGKVGSTQYYVPIAFTHEEIDFIKKAISMAIIDCETNPPKPSEEQLKLMWSIKAKCDELLKERVNNE